VSTGKMGGWENERWEGEYWEDGRVGKRALGGVSTGKMGGWENERWEGER
jgi:hypothetical protein